MNLGSILAVVLAAAGLTVVALVLVPSSGQAEAISNESSRQCLECHADVAAEWESSQHAQAFINPEVRKLSNDFRNEECLACHAPRPVLGFEPGERVLFRQSERDLGVDCLACHLAPGGGVGTSNATPNDGAACRPLTIERMGSVEHCASCHNQHGTVDQWRAAPPELKRTGCLDCHMPEVRREGGRIGRDHRGHGGHNPEMVKRAVELKAGWPESGPWVSVQNVGAGHSFPTDERSRAADTQVRWQMADGTWSEWIHVYRMRDPYRDEVDLVNTILPAGETWRQEVKAPEGAVAGESRLMYRTNPFQSDEDALEVHRTTMQP